MNLKLFHVQVEGMSNNIDEYVVAESEGQARNNAYNKWRSQGYSKNNIYACEIEVEGYTIQITENL